MSLENFGARSIADAPLEQPSLGLRGTDRVKSGPAFQLLPQDDYVCSIVDAVGMAMRRRTETDEHSLDSRSNDEKES